ncbi:MAG: SMC-Scp complex subunit ScpB [Planctomycetales bacterium 12-60-4]|nr:MAG: SMC-Scp complex subunit ScpB [Planctomycetales bacterium 12-60-4]
MKHTGSDPWSSPRAWSTVPVAGRDWLFWRNPDVDATLLSLDAVDRRLQRTQKMARVEAALLVAAGPMSTRKLMQIATLPDVGEANALIEALNQAYDLSRSPFRIERVATGYQMLTRPEYAHWLGRLHQRQAELKLTPAALETLTILAYRQPMTRADLESVRGVQCTELLKMLMDRGLVRIAGEDNSLGRPFLYETTRKFLETYGLRNLDDLPRASELRVSRTSQEPPVADADAA